MSMFRLIRPRMLLFVAFMMYVMRYFVLRPMLTISELDLQMSNVSFALLVLSVCSMVAAAYTINDYFDMYPDHIMGRNVIIGRTVSRRQAIVWHTIFSLLSLGLAFWLSWSAGIWRMGIYFVLASGVIWFHASSYKHYFIVGNVIVALLVALIPVIIVLYEIPWLNQKYYDILNQTGVSFLFLFRYLVGFSVFLFANVLLYEIAKDLYTIKGDVEMESDTLPIVLGEKKTRYIMAALIGGIVIGILVLYSLVFVGDNVILLYFILALILPYLYLLYVILKEKGGEKMLLNSIRIIILLGVSFSFVLPHFFDQL